MAALKPGETVFIVEREPASEDAKSGLYYSHFANLSGTVDRIYDDGVVCVDVNIDTLPDGIRRRHEDTEQAAKAKWLDSLSGEARGRLTEDEKQFRLSYKILVSAKDLSAGRSEKGAGAKAGAVATKAKPSKLPPPQPAPKPAAAAKEPKPARKEPATEVRRLTQKDIEDAEKSFLEQRMRAQGKSSKKK